MTEDGLNLSSQVSRSERQVSCEIDEEIVALSIDKGSYFHVDKVGAEIWKLLETPLSVGSLCERLGDIFEVDRERCQLETMAFLKEMGRAGLVEWHEGDVAKA